MAYTDQVPTWVRGCIVALVAVIVFALGLFILGAIRSDGLVDYKQDLLVVAGADRAPSATAADWVINADHVVVATVRSEIAREPSATELSRGEGLIQRDLTMSVDHVVWSHVSPRASAPKTFNWLAYGWEFTTEPERETRRMTGEHEPRFEIGHTYLMALQWQPSRCSTGDYVPAQWRGLGSGALLPYDNSRIGEGEFEGRWVSSATASARWSEQQFSLAEAVAGETSEELARALLRATRGISRAGTSEPSTC